MIANFAASVSFDKTYSYFGHNALVNIGHFLK